MIKLYKINAKKMKLYLYDRIIWDVFMLLDILSIMLVAELISKLYIKYIMDDK